MTLKLPEDTQLDGLPAYWQEQIRKLRLENRQMRLQRNEARERVALLSLKLVDHILPR